MALDTSLPEDQCEWCGAPIKHVRLLPAGKITIKIDADPLPPDGWDINPANGNNELLGVYRRARPSDPEYRIDGVYHMTEGHGWREKIQYSYAGHKRTCPNASMWASGHARSPDKSKKAAPHMPRKPVIQADDVRVDPEEDARAEERIRLARTIFQADILDP